MDAGTEEMTAALNAVDKALTPETKTAVTDANARLIAAAPEMLGSCKRAVESLGEAIYCLRLLGHSTTANALCIIQKDLRRQIAKAEPE